jgi:hypothetical protein
MQLAIPPHIVAGAADQLRQRFRAIDVSTGVTEEDASH